MIKNKFLNFCMILVFATIIAVPMVANVYHYCGRTNNLEIDYATEFMSADILDGSNATFCNDYPTPYVLDNKNNCLYENYQTHGPGRSNGGTGLLSAGCRNYATNGFYYGSYNIAYWINMTNMNRIANENARAALIQNIHAQIELWNAVEMVGIGKIVNLYEIGVGSTQKPADSEGRKVIEILQGDLREDNWAGVFSHNGRTLTLCYDEANSKSYMNTDTIVHEFGHVLGLTDLETDGTGVSPGTHKTLMSYKRGTSADNLYCAIKYPDIQGVAVMLGRHVCKDTDFVRYVKSGTKYYHICFYCDRIDKRSSAISGSLPVTDNNTCTHNYQEFVSAGTTHWKKCTKCYKVVEYHVHDFKYFDSTSTGHTKECVCGAADMETHNFVDIGSGNFKCTQCSYIKYHTHSYTYVSEGIGKHTATCKMCGFSKLENCVSFKTQKTCLLCKGPIIGGIIVMSEGWQEQVALTLRSLALDTQPQIILP